MEKENKKPDVRFEGFCDDWTECNLDEVVNDFYNGQTPSRMIDSYWNGEINWLSSGELNRGVVKGTIEKITPLGMKSANLKNVSKGTFVMAITGLEAAGTRGNCAILGINTTLNQSCMAIYPNPKLLDSHFLFQWYRRNSEEYGLKYTQGTKQQSYNAGIIKKIETSLPCVKEQKKIANLLKNLDNLITQNQKKYNKLLNLKKAMLDKMFPKKGADVPEIRFKGFSGAWVEKKLGEITDTYSGGTPSVGNKAYYDGSIPFIRSGEINAYLTELFITEEGLKNSSAKLVEKGDILYALYGATSGEVGISQINGAINQAILAIKPKVNYNSYFLAQWLRKEKETIVSTYLQGGQGNLSGGIIKNLNVPIPLEDDEQARIGEYFENLDILIVLNVKELTKLRNLKKAMLEKMFV